MADMCIPVYIVLLIAIAGLHSGASSSKPSWSGSTGEAVHTRETHQPQHPLNVTGQQDHTANTAAQSASTDADRREHNETSISTVESDSALPDDISAISNFSDLYNFTSSKNMTLAHLYERIWDDYSYGTDLARALNISATLGIDTVEQLENITSQLNISLFGELNNLFNNHNISNEASLWDLIYNMNDVNRSIANTQLPDVTDVNGPVANTQPPDGTDVNGPVANTQLPDVTDVNGPVANTQLPDVMDVNRPVANTQPPDGTDVNGPMANTQPPDGTDVNGPVANTQPPDVTVTRNNSYVSPITEQSSTIVSPTTDEMSRMETVTNDESWVHSSPRPIEEGSKVEGTTLVYTRENRTYINLSDWTNNPEFSGMVAVLVIGCLCVILVVVLFAKRFYDLYQHRHYTKMDYLINGMYN